jgi:hypothetical protein
MFVMLSVRTSPTVRERQAESVTKDVKVADKLKNINCIKSKINQKLNNHTTSSYKIVEKNNCNLNSVNTNNQCTIDKTVKKIIPSLSVDTSTILSPSTLATNQPPQNSSKFILTELNNFREPSTVQVNIRDFFHILLDMQIE